MLSVALRFKRDKSLFVYIHVGQFNFLACALSKTFERVQLVDSCPAGYIRLNYPTQGAR